MQVTFTLGSQYEVNINSGLIQLESVGSSEGTFFDDAALEFMCEKLNAAPGHTFPNKSTFVSSFSQTCAPLQ